MELRILGCSGGEANGERLTGLLVNGCVAIDAGSLTAALTVDEQIKIHHVFISHSHLDHICTLPFFTKNIFGHTHEAVEIHALPETLDVLRRHLFNDELWPDFSVIPSPNDPTIRYTDIEAERTYDVCGLRITPIRVNHLVPCVGYKVEDGKTPSSSPVTRLKPTASGRWPTTRPTCGSSSPKPASRTSRPGWPRPPSTSPLTNSGSS